MNKKKSSTLAGYAGLLKDVKSRIQQAQTRAMLSVNAELLRLYWDIGQLIDERQGREGWGATVIPRLSRDLDNELPEVKGFSERNIKRMLAFRRTYPSPALIVPQAVAQLSFPPLPRKLAAKTALRSKVPQAVAQLDGRAEVPQLAAQPPGSLLWLIPWGHHAILLEKVKDIGQRIWYMQQTLANGWSRNVLTLAIESGAHARQGKAVTNFDRLLPSPQSDLAQQTLKDPYIFDFLTLAEPFRERELETNLLLHVEKFLLELGQGFAFVGRQYRITIDDDEFSIDLLFYHLKLRSFVVIDLKTGAFKAEYAGKMNLYLSAIDDQLRHPTDSPTIGLILCQGRNRVVAEYALRGMTQPIGVSQYELTRDLPRELQSSLPSIDEIEAEL
ncbi:MAG: hypothetical protein B7Z74_08355, partial [Deltaproteobacteria bacterium 21-66-5]